MKMALVRCRECSGQISSQAKVCPHCGVTKPARSKGTQLSGRQIVWFSVAGIVGLMILIGASDTGGQGAPAAPATPDLALLAKCKGLINTAKNAGLVDSLTWRQAPGLTSYSMVVENDLWAPLDFTAKTGFARAAACVAGSADTSIPVSGTIYDSENHKDIGELSALTGEFTSKEKPLGQ